MDDESEEDGTKLAGHLVEEEGELADIKGFALIHAAGKDVGAVPHEVTYSLDDCPGAHVGRDAWLVGELEVVEAEDVTEEADDDPIELFQYQWSNTHTSVVLWKVYASELVFYYW